MILEIVTWDLKSLENRVKTKKGMWLNFFILFVLFIMAGLISTFTTDVPKELSKTLASLLLTFGSAFNFLSQIIIVFALFKILQLILKLNISNKQLAYVGIIGATPILISSVFNIICNIFFGHNIHGYTSILYFMQPKNHILNNLFQTINPFIFWQIFLTSALVVYLTSKNKKWIIALYSFVFFIVRVLVG